MSFKPTAQQQAILDELLSSTSSLAIIARAGCGKTSTILLIVDQEARRNPKAEIVVCAYNKPIADEVKEKLTERGHSGRNVMAATIHSLGFGLIRFALGNPKVNGRKVREIIEECKGEIFENCGAQIEQLVRMAKQSGVGFFDDMQIGNNSTWYDLASHYDINGFDDTSMMDEVVRAAQHVYRQSLKDTTQVDFDDMVLLPLVKNIRIRFQKDLLIVDEAQDLSRVRQALARKFLKPEGRMVIVGDDRQAIYGFSGADAEALNRLSKTVEAKIFPLSISWRCPQSVIREAQKLVPDIQASPSADEGKVERITKLPDNVGPGTAILCRNTAPLVQQAYSLIGQGKAAKVEGKDIGEGLAVLARRWKVNSIDMLLQRLEAYEQREVQKAIAKGNEQKVEQTQDKCQTLRVICEACLRQNKKSTRDVLDFIGNLFSDDATGCIVLATYHRSKGREWPQVILFEHSSRCPSKAAKLDWQKEQERNLAYVAITRAQRELLFWN
jgi:superfamily I DNA/RNA helicase